MALTNLSVTCSQPRAGLLTVGHSTGRRDTAGDGTGRQTRPARTPVPTVLPLVPHFTSRELDPAAAAALWHRRRRRCGGVSVLPVSDGRVTSIGSPGKEMEKTQDGRARRGVWSLVSPTATIRAVNGCELSSSWWYRAFGPGESAKCPPASPA